MTTENKTSQTTEPAIAVEPVLCPVVKHMCKYCTKYEGITRSNNGVILQGKCTRLNKMVWKDQLCDHFTYNGA